MCTVKTQKHRFPFIIISTIVPNDGRTETIALFFNAFLFFVLISYHIKPLTEIRTN